MGGSARWGGYGYSCIYTGCYVYTSFYMNKSHLCMLYIVYYVICICMAG